MYNIPLKGIQTLMFVSMFNKASEFHTWLVEERKINPETVSKDQNKKEFSRFVEDFNTGMSHWSTLVIRQYLSNG